MPYSLKNRNVLITGGSRGLGALIAEKFAAEGSNVLITYVTNEARAKETDEAQAKETVAKVKERYGVKVVAVQADAGVSADNIKAVQATVKELGGLDIIVANAGWTRFSNFADLSALSGTEWDKCWSTNVKSNLELLQGALPTFKTNPEGGALLMTSSVAGVTQGGSSMAYSVTKAAGLHLMKCMAATQGPKVRVNAVLPGLLMTEWGHKYSTDQVNALKERSALKAETDLDDCAEAFIMAAKNSSMTGQQVQIDAGLVIH